MAVAFVRYKMSIIESLNERTNNLPNERTVRMTSHSGNERFVDITIIGMKH